jgi:quinol monooxygenase YgiN
MMEKVRVIARAVAKPGKGSELRRLLSGVLAPTRAVDGCEFYDLFESHQPGRFYSTSFGPARRLWLSTLPHPSTNI